MRVSSSFAIPSFIHQTWKDANPPPGLFKPEWIASWKSAHPGWRYRLWTDADNRRLIQEAFPWFLDTYDAYPLDIHRADAVRYFILHRFGGVYVDLDFQSLRSISPLLASSRLVLGLMGQDKTFPDAIPNAFMASVPQHPLWPHMFEALRAHAHVGRVEERTGPILLKKVLADRYPELFEGETNELPDVRLIGDRRIYPIDWREGSVHKQTISADVIRDPGACFPDAYCITYWTRCWSADERAARSRTTWRRLKRAFEGAGGRPS